VKLCCPVDGTWTVDFRAENWKPDGLSEFADGPIEMVAGKCERCGSLVLCEASETAVRTAAARVAATKQAMAKVAHSARPASAPAG
jgi:hypothetical protein